MPSQCSVCAHLNPDEARYCYYDGRSLSSERGQGPLQVGSLPFPTPFYFADGQACTNFNQLALACVHRWDEACALLAQGIWHAFFGNLGRLDLAAAAREAAADPDRDFGLSRLLERLPVDPDCLRPPQLALQSASENLGPLVPGTDRSFDLVIVNQGMLALRGVIAAQCDWLVLGDRGGPAEKMFQTRTFFSIRVWVVGSRLHAGLMPLEGDLAIESNGGSKVLPVRAEVPVRPFPAGVYANDVLAGVRSPREVAVRAKTHANEAAVLFEQGAVKAWYASNGWTYPVEGSQGSGKGAVQQFFEALGLVRPPRVEIDTTALVIHARPGEHVARRVRVGTEEAKPVYAQAASNQSWLTIGLIKYRGNKVNIPVDITAPDLPGETLHAELTIEANGRQRFVVPVSVHVAKPLAPGAPIPVAAAAKGLPAHVAVIAPPAPVAPDDDAAPSPWRWAAWLAAGFGAAMFTLVMGVLLLFIAWRVLQRLH